MLLWNCLKSFVIGTAITQNVGCSALSLRSGEFWQETLAQLPEYRNLATSRTPSSPSCWQDADSRKVTEKLVVNAVAIKVRLARSTKPTHTAHLH